jgi:hypothetical protein
MWLERARNNQTTVGEVFADCRRFFSRIVVGVA